MFRLTILTMLALMGRVCEAKPKMNDFLPKWKDGLSCTTALTAAKAAHFNHLGEGHQVFNDLDGPAFQADATAPPLLDWPLWSSGKIVGETLVLRLEKKGDSAFTEEFVWRKGKPWWSRAERSCGTRQIKTRLL